MPKERTQLNLTSLTPASVCYQRHKPEDTNLYKIIEQNLPSFQSYLSSADISLPQFVDEEFREYLRCSLLEHSFIHVKCDDCTFEHLVAFSCNLRGFCPSCGARRMIETPAYLVDSVMLQVPVWQWALSFPRPLRLLLHASLRPSISALPILYLHCKQI
jgi:ribosomal protein S27E